MTKRFEEAIQWGEKAARLGAPGAREFVATVRQMLGQAPEQPQLNEHEQVVQQVVTLYRQYGEAGLRQLLSQKGLPTTQIDEIITFVKQASGE